MPTSPSTPSGLSAAEAARRLASDGPNELPGGRRRGLWVILLDTLHEPMFLLLLAAGTLYLAFGDLQEGLTLLAFVLATVGLTLYQEGKTERAIEALRDMTNPRALVIRDGAAQRVAGREVVCGDLLKLGEGDRIPADALLVTAEALQVDESLLTGEAVPVGKRPATADELAPATSATPAAQPSSPGGEDRPTLYAGTLIVRGQALARVDATGARSEIGRIGTALDSIEPEPSPLQQRPLRWCAAWPGWPWR